MDPLPKALSIVFVVTTMLSIGLQVTVADMTSTLRRRGLMVRSIAANFIVIPLLGLLLVNVLPMSEDARVALLLLAAAPGGLNALQFTSKTKGALPFAGALLFILSLLAVLFSPFIAGLILRLDTPLVLPYGKVVGFLVLLVFVPLLAGLAVHRFNLRLSAVLGKIMALVGTIAFVVVVFMLLTERQDAAKALTGAELAGTLGLILGSMVTGWLMGGPTTDTRRVLVTNTSMRNAALCLLIAVESFPGSNVDVAVVAFSGLMIFPNFLFTTYEIILGKRKAKADKAEANQQ